MGCSRQDQEKCVAVGKPVNPILGCKILTEAPDVFVDAHLPLVWRRTYASDVAYEGMLGQGWSFDFGYRMQIQEEEIHLYDAHGTKCLFPRLEVGKAHLEPKGRRELLFVSEERYIYHVGNRYYHFVSSEASQGLFRLTHIKDANDNAIQFFYEGAKHFPSFIALDNQRLFRLLGSEHRLLGLEELEFDKTSLRKNLLESNDTLWLLHYTQEDDRLRLGSIETFVNSEEEKERLFETYGLHETLETRLSTMVRYAYSDAHDLVAVYGLDDVLLRTFTYTNHVMTSHSVPEGLESYYEYDDYSFDGKVLKNHTNTGQVWYFEYQEKQTIVTDALGRETVYRFDAENYFTSKLNPLHQESVLRYTPQGLLKEIVDASGKSKHFDFNDEGLLKESRVGMLGATTYRYHLKHKKPIAMEDARGKTRFGYDDRANLIEERLPNKERITYERDLYGNPTEITNALGTATLVYNASGNLTQHTNVEGEVTTLEYDTNENLIKLTDIYGDVTHYSYDAQNRLIEVQHPDGNTESYTYSPLGSLLSHTNIHGTTTHYTTDKADNLVEIVDPSGRAVHFDYDVEGRLEVQVDPSGKKTAYTYDVLDRVIESKDALGDVMAYRYDETHHTLQSITDPSHNTTHYEASMQGEIRTEISPYLEEIHYLYEPQDNQLAQKQYKDNSMVNYSYTQPNNLLNLVSATGMTQAFVYDTYQRLAKAEATAGALGNEKREEAIHTVELAYHNTGELKTQTQNGIEVTEEKETKRHAKTLHFLDLSLTTTHKTKKCQTLLSLNEQMPIVLSYDAKARTQTISYPNNHVEHYTFNESQELVQLQTAEQTLVYQRDTLGCVTQKRTQDKNIDTEVNYSYDAIGRLTQANDMTFTYDKAGNLQSPQHHYDTTKNQLLEDATYTYTYDARGNLKGKVNKTNNHYTYYTFNGLNQLTAVYTVNQNDEIIHYLRYEYDAFNRRVSKEENTVKHYYLYDKENIIAILDTNKNHLATIVHHPSLVDTPLSITNIHGTFYYHRDHQGSIVALTDEQGQIVESIEYDNTYGKVITHTQKEPNYTLNPYGYTGREMDAHDLYYYRARYYDPNTQRFLSLDPIGFEAGDFNFYRYVGNDPVNFRDPSGLDPRLTGAGVPAAMNPVSSNGGLLSGIAKGTKDIANGLLSLPQGAWGYYKHLLNATGYTDLVKGNEKPICKCQALVEEKIILKGLTDHKSDIAKAIWKDMKERPNYWIVSLGTASAVGTVTQTGKAAVQSATVLKIEGGITNAMNSKINNSTGCY